MTKDGYKSYKTTLSTKPNTWVFGNILFGFPGFFSTTTDGKTGAMTEFSPHKYFIMLSPVSQSDHSSTARKIKEFVVVSGDPIRFELAGSGGGEKTDALAGLIDSNNKDSVIIVLKQLSDESKDDLELAKKLLNFTIYNSFL